MTRILAIEGTGIREEIRDCLECPCRGGRFGRVECEARGHHDRRPIGEPPALDAFWISPDCPLPEKKDRTFVRMDGPGITLVGGKTLGDTPPA